MGMPLESASWYLVKAVCRAQSTQNKKETGRVAYVCRVSGWPARAGRYWWWAAGAAPAGCGLHMLGGHLPDTC